jgi:hypothetical protein
VGTSSDIELVIELRDWEALEVGLVGCGVVCEVGKVVGFLVGISEEVVCLDDFEVLLDVFVLEVFPNIAFGCSVLLVKLCVGSYEAVMLPQSILKDTERVVSKAIFMGDLNVYPWALQLLVYSSYC